MAPIKRIGVIGFGHVAKEVLDYLFDYVIYGIVMIWATQTFGPTQGPIVCFVIMSVATAVMCLVLMVLYDIGRVDWLGIEWLKELRDGDSRGWFWRNFQRLLRSSNLLALIFFSIWEDAFVTTAYLRKGSAKYNGMSARDWKVFLTSVVISNVWWTIGWTGVTRLGAMIFVRLPGDAQQALLDFWNWSVTWFPLFV